jgi:hypothetical protein
MGQRKSPVFSGKFSLGLLALLLVPFAIKSVIYAEPWPAVILPSGAITIAVENGVARFPVTNVAVVGPEQQRQPIDPALLFSPVPIHYLFTMVASGVGQDSRPYREVQFKRFGGVWRKSRVPPSEEERRLAREWLRAGAKRAGLAGDSISIRSQQVSVAMRSGQELSREDVDEILVPLR